MTDAAPPTRWHAGDGIVLRYITRQERPGMSWPARVVEDRDDLLALFIPQGAITKQWRGVRDAMGQPVSRELVDIPWRRDTLRLMYPGEDYSIWLSWRPEDGERVFHGYYINVRLTERGIWEVPCGPCWSVWRRWRTAPDARVRPLHAVRGGAWV